MAHCPVHLRHRASPGHGREFWDEAFNETAIERRIVGDDKRRAIGEFRDLGDAGEGRDRGWNRFFWFAKFLEGFLDLKMRPSGP